MTCSKQTDIQARVISGNNCVILSDASSLTSITRHGHSARKLCCLLSALTAYRLRMNV